MALAVILLRSDLMNPAQPTLWLSQVQAVLERLHHLAEEGDESLGEQVRSDPAWKIASSEQKAIMLREALLPVSRDAGRFMYALTRSSRAKRIKSSARRSACPPSTSQRPCGTTGAEP